MKRLPFILMILFVFILVSCNKTEVNKAKNQNTEGEKQETKNTQDIEIIYSLTPKDVVLNGDPIKIFEYQFKKRLAIYEYGYDLQFQGENNEKLKLTVYKVKKDEVKNLRKVMESNVADLEDNDFTQYTEDEREAIKYLISTDYPFFLKEEKSSILTD